MSQTIIVGFSSHPGSWFSKIIQWATNSPISHTYVRIPVPEYKTSVVFQAQGMNVHYTNYDEFIKKAKVIEEIAVEVSDEQYKQAEIFRVFQCGKPYGIMEIIGFCWVILGHKLGKHWPNPFNDGTDSYVCSSVVCRQIGLVDDATISPADLYEILKKKSDLTK
jgi:hypothetical protein